MVCFDLDETLIVAAAAWRQAFVQTMTAVESDTPALRAVTDFGTLHDEVYRPLIEEQHASGDGDWDSRFVEEAFRRLLSGLGIDGPDILRRAVDRYHRAWPALTHLYDDALPVLDALAATHRLALITDGASHEQRLKIERHGLAERFEVIAVSREVGARKPDPAIFRHALDALDVPGERAVHVGDVLERDVAGAQATGMRGVWLNRTAQTRPPDGPQPDAEITSLAPLPGLLDLR